jgi:hypothetical protein
MTSQTSNLPSSLSESEVRQYRTTITIRFVNFLCHVAPSYSTTTSWSQYWAPANLLPFRFPASHLSRWTAAHSIILISDAVTVLQVSIQFSRRCHISSCYFYEGRTGIVICSVSKAEIDNCSFNTMEDTSIDITESSKHKQYHQINCLLLFFHFFVLIIKALNNLTISSSVIKLGFSSNFFPECGTSYWLFFRRKIYILCDWS